MARLIPRISVLLLCAISCVSSYVIDSLSFGQNKRLSPNRYAIPGWHISGEGYVPQLLSDKIILTPPYPGNRRGALWTEKTIEQSEWSVEFEFRASGQEHGAGNIQVWYTTNGQTGIGSLSLYTVGKFEGLALIIDGYGGQGGGIRGFLNDGTVDYRNHHHIEELAFGHCDYSYRNLGRPSKIQMRQDSTGFEVIVDGHRCFGSSQVKLPGGNYFGVTAATSETPDSFEVYKFVVSTTSSTTREEPNRQQPISLDGRHPASKQPISSDNRNAASKQHEQAATDKIETVPDADAASITTQQEQFRDLHVRLQIMAHTVENMYREVLSLKSEALGRIVEASETAPTKHQVELIDTRLDTLEKSMQNLKTEVKAGMKDYTYHFNDVHASIKARNDHLLDQLPSRLAHVVRHFLHLVDPDDGDLSPDSIPLKKLEKEE
ncbi:hypothetical protein MMC25_001020 [Agyrium rufum]|nr:hypothetical protein [Agyrium rufum]